MSTTKSTKVAAKLTAVNKLKEAYSLLIIASEGGTGEYNNTYKRTLLGSASNILTIIDKIK